VFTSLPGPPEVEAVALGADGLLSGLRKDAACFDLSTNSPSLVRRIHTEFAKKSVHMLDAPVSGGPVGARSGRMAIWVGGDEAVFRRHKAVLDAMGDQARYIGPIGAGSVAKLVHNCAGYAVQTALADGKILGAGLDVFDREPPPADNPLFVLDNVALTAHFAGPTWDNNVARFRNAFDNVQRVHRGERPLWVVPELAD